MFCVKHSFSKTVLKKIVKNFKVLTNCIHSSQVPGLTCFWKWVGEPDCHLAGTIGQSINNAIAMEGATIYNAITIQ